METGWRHDDPNTQREFERIHTKIGQSKKASDGVGAGGGEPASQQIIPPSDPGLISGAIYNEVASPRSYIGIRLTSDTTIDITKRTTDPDRLFVFDVSRPLTVEHNEVAVVDEPGVSRSDTVRFIDFKDEFGANGITFTVTNHKDKGIQIKGVANVLPVCVYGANIGSHPSIAVPLSWYVDTQDVSGCKVLEFKKFNVTGDLKVTTGTNSYIFNVDVVANNLGADPSLGWYSHKDNTTSTLWFRSPVAGTNVSLDFDVDTITINATDTNTTYGLSAVSSSGVKIRLTGSDSTTNDVKLSSSDGTVIITWVSATEIDLKATGGGGGGGNTYGVDNVGSSGAGVWRDTTNSGSAYTFHLRKIKAGANVSVTENADDITIACTVSDTNTTYTYNALDGLSANQVRMQLLGSDASSNVITLIGGSNVTVSRSGSSITIASSYTDTNTTYTYYAVTNALGAVLRLHGSDSTDNNILLKGGGATTVSWVDATTVLVSSTDNDHTYAIDNCATATGAGLVYHDSTVVGSLETFHLRKLLAGAGISITTLTHDISIACTVTDTNTTYDTDVVDVGGVYLRLNGSDSSHSNTLFTGSGGIVISRVDAHTINIANTVVDTNNLYAIDNCASGTGTGFVYHDSDVSGSLTTFHLRTIKAGANVSVTTTSHDIVVACTLVDTNDLYYVDNVGTGAGHVWRNTTDAGSSHTHHLKTIKAGSGISVTDNADDITIACYVVDTNTLYSHRIIVSAGVKLRLDSSDSTTDDILFSSADGSITISRISDDNIDFVANFPTQIVYSIDNCASGTGTGFVYHDSSTVGSTVTHHLRTLKAGSNVTISTSGHDITISSSYVDTNDTYTVANVGTGDGLVWRDTTDAGSAHTINLKSIKDGNYIDVVNNTNDITINAWTITGGGYGSCSVAATPYNFFYDAQDDSGTKTRTMRFRNFGVTNDLHLNECVPLGGWVFDVNVVGVNDGSGAGLYNGKTGSTLHFLSLYEGTNISIDPVADGWTISCTAPDTNTTYTLETYNPSGQVFLRLTGSDASHSDIELISHGNIAVWTGTGTVHFQVPYFPVPPTYDVIAIDEYPTLHQGASIYLTCSDVGITTNKVLIYGGGATTVVWEDDYTIRIDSTDTANVYWMNNIGSGNGLVYKNTTGSYPNFTFNLRRITGQNDVDVNTSGDDILVSSSVILRDYTAGQSFYVGKTHTSGVTYLDIKGLRCTDGTITVSSNSVDVLISAVPQLSIIASTVTQSTVTTVEFHDSVTGIKWGHGTGTAHKSVLTAKFVGYNTRCDDVYFVDSGVKVKDKTVGNRTWEYLWFDVVNITDDPGWITKNTASTPPWYCTPNDEDECTYLVNAALSFMSKDVTNNALPAAIKWPELALYDDSTFVATLDVNTDVGAYAELRADYLTQFPGSSAAVPQSGSIAFLHGTTTVKSLNTSGKLHVRFYHATGVSRYIKLTGGYIDIVKLGVKTAIGGAVQPKTDFTLW